MGGNKSARKRQERHERTERLYSSKHAMGNVDFGVMRQLATEFGVPVSRIISGYLHQPINYSGSDHVISGYCNLLDKDGQKCEYKIPQPGDICESCIVYQRYFNQPAPNAAEEPSKLEKGLEEADE
jgi:hypothetical protein